MALTRTLLKRSCCSNLGMTQYRLFSDKNGKNNKKKTTNIFGDDMKFTDKERPKAEKYMGFQEAYGLKRAKDPNWMDYIKDNPELVEELARSHSSDIFSIADERELQNILEKDRVEFEKVQEELRSSNQGPFDPLNGHVPDALQSTKILTTSDEQLSSLDLQYKRILLGGVSKEEVEEARTAGDVPDPEHFDNTRHSTVLRLPKPRSTIYERKVNKQGHAIGVGRDKTSTAYCVLKPGSGMITINGRDYVDYFTRLTARVEICKAFLITRTMGEFDVDVRAFGGGVFGQRDAIRHGISRALAHYNPDLRSALTARKMLTRDPRMVERKKFGKVKARKSPSWNRR